MYFSDVANHFAAIEKVSGRLEITRILAELLAQADAREAYIIVTLALGQLNPPYVGTQFAIAAKNMLKVAAAVLQLPVDEVEALVKETGDIGQVVEKGSWKPGRDLSVTEVFQALHTLEKVEGTGSQEEKITMLAVLLRELEPIAAKYVTRIILGQLRLGFSDMTIVDALSWMQAGNKSLRAVIEDAYNIRADIGLIAYTLKEHGVDALKNMQVQVGIPIRPAAAERLPNAAAVIEKLGDCVAQPKLDGFRLQIHVNKTEGKKEVRFFSRNLIDMSAMFPDLAEAALALPVKELICEGEAIVFDVDSGTFLPFQETVKRKRKHGIQEAIEEYPLRVFVFDLLYLDGTEYLSVTHTKRRAALEALFSKAGDTVQNVITIIDEKKVTTAQQLDAYFFMLIGAGLEGLVVKKPDSVYQPGKRNFNWIKLKRQETGHLIDTIDCVILGYNSGSGKRAAFGIGALLVGVYNKAQDRFETVAKIGTGFKDEDWATLKYRCDALASKTKPHNVSCDKPLEPDVWVHPTIVCLIRADEITLSPVHTAGKTSEHLGYALRFPRFMGYREDKTATEATTVSEVAELYSMQRK